MADHLSQAITAIRQICQASEGRSQCFSFGAHGFYDGARHYLESSSDTPRITVQPGTVENLQQIMRVLARHNVLFAIKGGGHTTNPSFSSTMSVQIYMCRLNEVIYNSNTTVTVGAGCVWDEVYHEMAKRGRNVVGGDREGGVGIAGYLLGGGYSLKTNQHGLGIDNITAIQVILPSGEVENVNEVNKSPLFEALKGGGNNFGIVTQYTLKTHEQGITWGGFYSYKGRQEGSVKAAIVDFISAEEAVPHSRAAMVAAFRYTLDTAGEVKHTISLFCVFDGPRPALVADDPWQRFQVIPHNHPGDAGLKERNNYREIRAMAALNHIVLPDLATKVDSETQIKWALLNKQGTRGRFGCIMVKKYTKILIDAIADETENASEDMKAHHGKMVVIDVWPFLDSIFNNSTPAAWPHEQGRNVSPLLAYFLWEDRSEDNFWRGRMQTALNNIRAVAIAEGCFDANAPVYLNNSLEDTAIEDIYRGKLGALSALRWQYDRTDVMGRTGGFKIPLPPLAEPVLPAEPGLPALPVFVALKTFNVEGYYIGADNGFMEFPLEYDTSSSKVRATGSDSAGYFTISGFFDGKDLRFIKQYSTWSWKYVGIATLQGEDVYHAAGGWGDKDVQHGSFAITILGVGSGGARKVSSAVRLEGEWSGTYTQGTTKRPMSLYLAVDGSNLKGSGQDGASPFTISGSFTDPSVTTKTDPSVTIKTGPSVTIKTGPSVTITVTIKTDTTSTSRVYSGVVDSSGALMRGDWKDSLEEEGKKRYEGKFELLKGKSITHAQAQEFMPKRGELEGSDCPESMKEKILSNNEKGLSSSVDGFAGLFEESVLLLVDGFAKLLDF
ncbi:hypothetical protein FIBSPDRAFT_937503 [Athelia psychrophila]|uniref:FAD-binding PCMH-type domain-containing protein n=1 Tax=Athelia psychrophila TaxID=1759441 RepID=A0A166ADN2_9AGAM|nr:hypothetical protein FIBSPDRAFT_937503 [Fibularhizoctonia sp. CBS 109695]